MFHWVDTSTGRLLLPDDIICPIISVSMCRYLYWWTITSRWYHLLNNQFHWVDTSTGGLLLPDDIICPIISVSLGRYLYRWTITFRWYHLPNNQCFTGSIPLQVDYYFPMISSAQQSVFHWVDTSTGGLLLPDDIICPIISVSLSRYLYW